MVMSKSVRRLCAAGLVGCLAVGAPATALAQRAEYASVDELKGEGLPHVLDVATWGQYSRIFNPEHVSGLGNMGTFELRTRLDLGKNPTYCAGLDGEIGGSDRGAVYGVTAYPIGLGARWGAGGTISLCGGAGFDGVASAVPLAARFPAELSIATNLGPLRPVLWARPSWIAGAEARKQGSSISILDELELGMLVRLSPQHRYWSEVSAGGGFSLGVAYREFMGTRYLAAVLGFDLVGAQ
jgi:hypothetical protein